MASANDFSCAIHDVLKTTVLAPRALWVDPGPFLFSLGLAPFNLAFKVVWISKREIRTICYLIYFERSLWNTITEYYIFCYASVSNPKFPCPQCTFISFSVCTKPYTFTKSTEINTKSKCFYIKHKLKTWLYDWNRKNVNFTRKTKPFESSVPSSIY